MQTNVELVNKMKEIFLEKISKEISKYNSVLITKTKYDSIISKVKRIKVSNKKKTSQDYQLLKRYDVLTIQDCDKLVEPLSNAPKIIKEYVHTDELFDILYSTHLSLGHGGKDKMTKRLNITYINITQTQIKMFLKLCKHCQPEPKRAQNEIVVKPNISSYFKSRCQVDLIDFQSHPDGIFHFLLVYQDHLTKFIMLKPLISKRPDEIASNLLDIFVLFGAPSILHSNNGREFCKQILGYLAQLWPEIKIVIGKSQENVEQANQDIENMLIAWMAINQTNKWSEGVRFIQFLKNRSCNSTIHRSPFEAMFGSPAKMGLCSSSVPQSVLNSINTEEDLKKLEKEGYTIANEGNVLMQRISRCKN